MMEGLRTPTELVVIVVSLLAYGCPIQAIVHAYGLDERTVADWQKRAGEHCQQVHHALVEQGKVKTHQVQADEIRAKGRKLVIWMGMAIDATSRLWMAGVVSVRRDRELANRLLQQVRSCCQFVQGLLVCTDGWNAYPKSIIKAFREKVKKTEGRGQRTAGRGRRTEGPRPREARKQTETEMRRSRRKSLAMAMQRREGLNWRWSSRGRSR